jgi:predicted alpha/beta superfamily hydrolase
MDITYSWHAYAAHPWGHTVVGDVRTLDSIYSPELRNQRKLYVYLPPSYANSDQRYPVIYMQDGQNLFDQALSYAGEWQVDETMEALSRAGIEAIVVGVPNTGARRVDEYSPFKDQRLHKGGRGDWYVAFLANTVKPLIDRDFRTLPEREHTGVLGSSMGGLISLYAFFCRPEVFGFVGAMSPSLWFAQAAIFSYVQQADPQPGRIHLDIGTHEGSDTRIVSGAVSTYTSRYLSSAHRMRELLDRKGYRLGHDLQYQEEEEATHNEAAWARRLPGALRFLLARYQRPAEQLVTAREPELGEPWWEF